LSSSNYFFAKKGQIVQIVFQITCKTFRHIELFWRKKFLLQLFITLTGTFHSFEICMLWFLFEYMLDFCTVTKF